MKIPAPASSASAPGIIHPQIEIWGKSPNFIRPQSSSTPRLRATVAAAPLSSLVWRQLFTASRLAVRPAWCWKAVADLGSRLSLSSSTATTNETPAASLHHRRVSSPSHRRQRSSPWPHNGATVQGSGSLSLRRASSVFGVRRRSSGIDECCCCFR